MKKRSWAIVIEPAKQYYSSQAPAYPTAAAYTRLEVEQNRGMLPVVEADIWKGTITFISSAYGASASKAKWIITDHPDKRMIGVTCCSSLDILVDCAKVHGNTLPLVEGSWQWHKRGDTLMLSRVSS